MFDQWIVRRIDHRIGLAELLVLLAAVVILWAIFRPRGPFQSGRP